MLVVNIIIYIFIHTKSGLFLFDFTNKTEELSLTTEVINILTKKKKSSKKRKNYDDYYHLFFLFFLLL